MKPDPSQTVVIFDLDGTFVDTAADLAAAMNHVLVAEGFAPIPAKRVRSLVGHGAKAMLKRGLADRGVGDLSESALAPRVSQFLAYYEAHIADRSRPFPWAVETAERLRARGSRLAICTNKTERLARLLLDALGLSSMFEAIVGGDTVGVSKPHPRPLNHCLALCGGGRAVMVGDSDTDLVTAAAAGAPSLLFMGGYGPVRELGLSAGVFGNHRALLTLVDRALLGGDHSPRHPVDHIATQIRTR
ncbi:MAG: HAD-IA family hydrolase [Parvularculaceae bacterium]|nr:HAD-IA family hydrolase [Parvularculaceae bacterium]